MSRECVELLGMQGHAGLGLKVLVLLALLPGPAAVRHLLQEEGEGVSEDPAKTLNRYHDWEKSEGNDDEVGRDSAVCLPQHCK